MRLLLIAALTLPLGRAAAYDLSALTALKLLPREDAARLARIEARDGDLQPERWYFMVYDPDAETGIREFVVANEKLVATRSVSQFAESLKESDVIGVRGVKVDSDELAKMAKKYAEANDEAVAKINYRLARAGKDAAPVWEVSCLDQKDQPIGALTVTAVKGSVIAHHGFAAQPKASPAAKEKKKTAKPSPDAMPVSTPLPVEPGELQPVPEEPPPAEPAPGRRGLRRLIPF